MPNDLKPTQSFTFNAGIKQRSVILASSLRNSLIVFVALTFLLTLPVLAQQTESIEHPVIVQPGAPGQPTRVLPPTTRAKLPPVALKDVEFMQGMIVHHAQAVEMTAMIGARTETEELRRLGARISQSQSDEINFMKRWLKTRGMKTALPISGMANMDMPDMEMSGHQHHTMPGMLSPKQMKALISSKGAEFDRLFLEGMIQHHIGALVMVKDLYDTAGAGQDAELFTFATDVDSGQRAEIKVMQNMLGKNPQQEN